MTTGTQTLKDAVNETMREWTRRIGDTHYVLDLQSAASVPYDREGLPENHRAGSEASAGTN